MNWEEKFDDMFPKIMGKYKVKGFPRGAFYEIKDLIRGELNAFSKPDVSQEEDGCEEHEHYCTSDRRRNGCNCYCGHEWHSDCKPLKEKEECICLCHHNSDGFFTGYCSHCPTSQPPSPIKGEPVITKLAGFLDASSEQREKMYKHECKDYPDHSHPWEKELYELRDEVESGEKGWYHVEQFIKELLRHEREEDHWSDSEANWKLALRKSRNVQDYIEKEVKKAVKSYQKEIVGKIKKQIDELPTIKHNTLEWVDKEVLLDILAILEQEKDK